MEIFKSHSLADTKKIAAAISEKLSAGMVLAFKGGMGAGKTTFISALVQALGIDAEVTSPTFSIVNEYIGNNITVYHFDMYRIEGFDALYSTGYFDYLDDTGSILLIEWSENIIDYLPENALFIEITVTGESSREFVLKGGGQS